MQLLVTFKNRFDATIFSRVLNKEAIQCLLMPTPRKLSASCGVCAILDVDDLDAVLQRTGGLEFQAVYKVDDENYDLLQL